MTDLASLVVRMQADNSQYIKALSESTKKLDSFAESTADAVKDIAGDFAGLFTIDAIVEFTKGALESAASLEQLSQQAGVSTEALSSLRLAAAASNVSQEELGQTFKKLNTSISEAAGNATSKAGQAFRALGISLASIKNESPDEVLGDIADKFKDLADGPNKTAIAVALLGKNGTDLIPVLNKGKEGLDEFKKAAVDAGLVVSSALAAAADEFDDKVTVLKASLAGGFGNTLAADLLPVLNAVAEALTNAGNAGAGFKVIADLIVDAVKGIAVVGVEVVSEFNQVGSAIGALAAEAVAVAHLNFAEASTIIKANATDAVATQKKASATISSILEAGTDKDLSYLSSAEAEKKRIRDKGVSLEGLGQSDDADKKLKEFSDGIRAQSEAFGLGGAALVKYKLQFGPLADAYKLASAAGKAAAAAAIQYATALQFKEDTKTTDAQVEGIQKQIDTFDKGELAAKAYELSSGDLGKAFDRMGVQGEEARRKVLALDSELIAKKDTTAIAAINDELLVLQGNLTKAAGDAFDLTHKALNQNIASSGTPDQAKAVQDLRDKTVAQAAFNEQVDKGNAIQTHLASIEADIALAQSQGQITELAAQAQLQTARATAVTQLNAVAAAERDIATSSGIPKLQEQTEQFATSIKNLASETNVLTAQIRDDLETSLEDPLLKAEQGTISLKDAFKDMAKSIQEDLLKIANKNIAESIFGTGSKSGLGGFAGLLAGYLGSGTSGTSTASIASTGAAAVGSDNGAVASQLAAAFAGSYADGGTIGAGKWGIVGERRPEVAYAGSRDLQISPTMPGSGMNVTNHFTIQSPNGTITRQSQQQIGAAAARSLSAASRRNN